MAGRQVFTEIEKSCLQELIVKYKLNSAATIAAGNPNVKKVAWGRLTEEFNTIETNNKRTEAQLKKCWDNMKTRRKQTLACEKRERMKTGGGTYPGPSTSQDSQAPIDGALQDLTDVEMRFVCDSDSLPHEEETSSQIVIVGEGSHDHQASTNPSEQVEITLIESGQSSASARPDRRLSDYAPQSQTPARASSEGPSRRTGSRMSDYGAQSQTSAARNVRAHILTEEFNLRKANYLALRERDEELHRLKIEERKWLLKAAEEQYLKARIDRESSEEMLKYSKAQRAEAELRLELLKKEKKNIVLFLLVYRIYNF